MVNALYEIQSYELFYNLINISFYNRKNLITVLTQLSLNKNYLLGIQMSNKKILLLTKYSRKGASSRLRTLQYLPYLENNGFSFDVQSLFNDAYLESLYKGKKHNKLTIIKLYLKRLCTLRNLKRYDLIWIEKEVFPYFPAIIEKLMKLNGINYIVDYDDAIFHNYDMSKNKILRTFLGNKIDKVMKYSETVIAGNHYLMQRAENSGAKQVAVIPTTVNHNKYENRYDYSKDMLTVGWIGSPMTQKYVVDILPALLAVNRKYPFRLLLVGASENIKNETEDLNIDILPWSEDMEVDLIRQMDIGIMPLINGPWEKGKCGYKLIQYMACGVAVIASPVGVNRDIVTTSNSGQLASSIEDWVSALSKAITSKELRYKNGLAGRMAVKDYYSIQSQVPSIINIINKSIKN